MSEQIKQLEREPSPEDIGSWVEVWDELYSELDPTPGPEDVGRWVGVRNSTNEDWGGPYIITDVFKIAPHFGAGNRFWNHATVVPGPIRGAMREHDKSNEKPKWLHDDDLVLVIPVDLPNCVTAEIAGYVQWNKTIAYQKLELRL